MDNSTPENVEAPVSAEDAQQDSAVPAFRVGFVVPSLHFKGGDSKQKRQVRAVMREAMKELQLEITDRPVGYRVHVQYSTKDLSETELAAARSGRKHPPCSPTEVAAMFADAAKGIVFTEPTRVYQFLASSYWGETDAVQVSIWELDFERKDGVQ